MSDYLNIRHGGALDRYLDDIKQRRNISTDTKAATYAIKRILKLEDELNEFRDQLRSERETVRDLIDERKQFARILSKFLRPEETEKKKPFHKNDGGSLQYLIK